MRNEIRYLTLLSGIASLIAGLYLIFQPALSLASLATFFMIVMLIQGIAELVQYFSQARPRPKTMLFNALLSIVLSLCVLLSSTMNKAGLIPYVFVLWLLFGGLTRIGLGAKLRKIDKGEGNYLLTVGILGLVGAILLLLHPVFTVLFVAYMIGFSFLYQGVINVLAFFRSRKAS